MSCLAEVRAPQGLFQIWMLTLKLSQGGQKQSITKSRYVYTHAPTRAHTRTRTHTHTHMQNEMQQQGPSVYMFNNTLSNIRHKLTATAFTVFILVITSQEDIHTAQPCTHTQRQLCTHTHTKQHGTTHFQCSITLTQSVWWREGSVDVSSSASSFESVCVLCYRVLCCVHAGICVQKFFILWLR